MQMFDSEVQNLKVLKFVLQMTENIQASLSSPLSEVISTVNQSSPLNEGLSTASHFSDSLASPFQSEDDPGSSEDCETFADANNDCHSNDTIWDIPRTNPNQPHDFCFPIDTSQRKFCTRWFKDFPWLEWDEGRRGGAALCFICRQGRVRGLLETGNTEGAFICDGYCNWKNGPLNFKKHESSENHRQMQYKLSGLLRGENVAARINVQADKQRKENTQNLLTIMSSLKFLARQGLAIRGHEDNDSNFNQLMLLRCQDQPKLVDWLSKKTSWTSHAIQDAIIKMMGMTVIREVAKDIQGKSFFAILADETADVSRIEQLVVCVRTVNDNLEANENVLGLHELSSCDAETITTTIKDILIRFELNINNCRAACFD